MKAAAGAHPAVKDFPGLKKCLHSIEEGTGKTGDIWIFLNFIQNIWVRDNTFCAHAPGAMEPLQSGLKYFKRFYKTY